MKNLEIYTKALELIKQVYILCKHVEKTKRDFSLCDQLKRASVSVACNISEGYGRTPKTVRHYLAISSGSANEVVTLLEVVNLVHDIDTLNLQESYRLLGKRINAYSRSIR
jgi:four helix bundle protein